MCFAHANSDLLFWQNLKKKPKPTTTLLGHSHERQLHYLTHLSWDQGGLWREKGSVLARDAWRKMSCAATDAGRPWRSFSSILPTVQRVTLHSFQATFPRSENYFGALKHSQEK